MSIHIPSADPPEELSERERERLHELHEKDKDDLTDEELTACMKLSLKRRFSTPEWRTVFEVQGPNSRSADAIAFGLYPSRQFPVVGIEMKASRNDWLSEKKDHGKAEWHVRQCDEWYIVAADSSVVNEEELPEGWGLIEMRGPGHKLYKTVESDLPHGHDGPPARALYHRAMKKEGFGDADWYTQHDVSEARRRGYARAKKEAKEDLVDYDDKKLQEKAEAFDRLRDSPLSLYSGSTVDDEYVKRLDRARRLLQTIESDSHSSLEGQIDTLRRMTLSHIERIEETCDELEKELTELREGADA